MFVGHYGASYGARRALPRAAAIWALAAYTLLAAAGWLERKSRPALAA